MRQHLFRRTVLLAAFAALGLSGAANGHPGESPPIHLAFAGLEKAYQASEPIRGEVRVEVDGPLAHGRLEVVIFDSDQCDTPEGCPNLLVQRSYAVEFRKAGTKSFRFGARQGVGAVSAYTAVATLTVGPDTRLDTSELGVEHSGHDRKVIATAVAGFGIRQPELAAVPADIRKAEITSLDVDAIGAALAEAAETGEATDLPLAPGLSVRARVKAQEILGVGVEIPGLGRPLSYVGEVIDEQGEVEADSFLSFLVVDGQLGGRVERSASSPAGSESLENVVIDALGNYDKHARKEEHLVYRGRNVLFEPGSHAEPPGSVEPLAPAGDADLDAAVSPAARWLSATLAATQVTAAAATPTRYFAVPIYVYEHFIDEANTRRRLQVVNEVAAIFRREFVNIPPRDLTGEQLTVLQFFVAGWDSDWKQTGYGSSCASGSDIALFGNAVPAQQSRGLRLIFNTVAPSDGDGCAALGRPAVSASMVNAFVKEGGFGSFSSLVIALQELGHNLDVHNVWDLSNSIPHDPHTDIQIASFWPVFPGLANCTAMGAGYFALIGLGFCVFPTTSYSIVPTSFIPFYNPLPLAHLSRGIREFFVESPVLRTVTGLPPGIVAHDLAVASNHDVWMTGSNFGIYRKAVGSAAWQQAPGGAERIAVDGGDLPWVVNLDGVVWRKPSADVAVDDWVALSGPGVARDIGVGGGQVWVIGATAVSGGNFEILKYNETANTWEKAPGAGVRISVDREGRPWVVNNEGGLWRKGSADLGTNDWVRVPVADSRVIDVAIGSSSSFDGVAIVMEPAVPLFGFKYVYFSRDFFNQAPLPDKPRWLPVFNEANGAVGQSLGLGATVTGVAVDLESDFSSGRLERRVLPWIATPTATRQGSTVTVPPS